MPGGLKIPMSQAELDWLREHYQDGTYAELSKTMSALFGITRNPGTLKTAARKKLGLYKDGPANERKFTEEQRQWMMDHYQDATYKELAIMFSERFGRPISEKNLMVYCRRMGCRKCANHQFTKSEDAWLIEQCKHKVTSLVAKEFSETFGVYCNSATILARMRKLGVYIGTEDRAGKEGYEHWHDKPIGAEVFHNGYLWVKVNDVRSSDRKTCAKNWRQKHLVVWEQHNGPVPEGHKIIHLDGNQCNCEIDNLRCIPFSALGMLARTHMLSTNVEITKASLQYAALKHVIEGKDTDWIGGL